MLSKGSAVVDEPYQAYSGPRVAPTTADQTAAYDLTRQGVGAYQPMVDTANQYLTQGGAGFNQGQFDQYMNPYISGVVDRIAELGGRNLSENLLPAVNDSFIRAGQFGGSRNEDFTLRALRDTNESVLGQQSQALAGGYNSAMDAFQRGQDQQLTAGQGLGSLAGSAQGYGLKDAAALQAIGQEQQGQTQKSLDTAYGDFLEQRGYPRQQAEWMSSLIRGMNPPTSSTTTSTGTASSSQLAPSGLAQLVGAGAGIGGLMGWFAKGGRVRRYQEGGPVRMPDIRGDSGETTKYGRRLMENEDGSYSSERTITVTDRRINGGRPTNIPSMFGGRQLSQEEAIRRVSKSGGADPESGRQLYPHRSIDEAVGAARKRSNTISTPVKKRSGGAIRRVGIGSMAA